MKKLTSMKKSELIEACKAFLKQKEEAEFHLDELKVNVEDAEEAVRSKDKELTEVKESLQQYKNDVVEKTKEIQNLRNQVSSLRKELLDDEVLNDKVNTLSTNLKVWKHIAIGAVVAFLIALCVIFA